MCIWKVKAQDRHCEVCKVWRCKDRPGTKTTWTGLAEKVRSLRPGQEIELKGKSYGSVRSQICRYNKSDLNVKYITLRVNDVIYVKRVK